MTTLPEEEEVVYAAECRKRLLVDRERLPDLICQEAQNGVRDWQLVSERLAFEVAEEASSVAWSLTTTATDDTRQLR